jgi:trans-2,3-dihydro-3-hydroxyanthranilate isomerase
VVIEPVGLDTAAMQTIAREFGHPETVFVFAPAALASEASGQRGNSIVRAHRASEDARGRAGDTRPEPGSSARADAAHRARVRIFTPARELPFAGHPTVGTAVLLGLRDGAAVGSDIVLEETIGAVRCTLEATGNGQGSARFAIPQLPAEAGPAPDGATIAAALGIAPAEIGFGAFRPARWSAGNPFTFVPIAGIGPMARCRPDPAGFDTAFGPGGAAYLFCQETVEQTAEPGRAFHARMFAPAHGVPEDPATGSAAAAFAGVLAPHLGDGAHAIPIEQGYEMGRPSLIRLAAVVAAGKLVSASIGGDAVIVTEGTIEA